MQFAVGAARTSVGHLPEVVLAAEEEQLAWVEARLLAPQVGEVIEDAQSAKVVWEATVHAEFSWRGKHRSPGETITLTARLVRVGGLWKLQQLHEGDKDGPQSHDAPAN